MTDESAGGGPLPPSQPLAPLTSVEQPTNISLQIKKRGRKQSNSFSYKNTQRRYRNIMIELGLK